LQIWTSLCFCSLGPVDFITSFRHFIIWILTSIIHTYNCPPLFTGKPFWWFSSAAVCRRFRTD